MEHSDPRHDTDPDPVGRRTPINADADPAPDHVASSSGVPDDPGADDALLGAVIAATPEALHVEHTLDVLISSVDLFDAPTWDGESG